MTIYNVVFSADNGLKVSVLAGDSSPVLSGGFGGWEIVGRPRRAALTRFAGRQPFRQDIPLRFEGYSSETSQESQITILQRMATQGADLSTPPKIRLGGIAFRKDLTWVIDDITHDGNSVLDTQGGSVVRIRSNCVVHLLEFIDDTVITTAASPAISAQSGKKKVTITTPKGMTLKQIAQLEYKDVTKGMQLILMANTWLSADPRKLIPEGTPLTIVDITTGIETEFIVP